MNNNQKSMDFFRPVRSTDPLVSRPVVPPAPSAIPKVKITSTPPTLRQSPNAQKEANPYLSGKPVVHSTVVMEKTVVSTTTSVPAPKPPVPQKPAAAPKKEETADDWFESLEAEGFFDEKPKSKVSYPFGGESPFLKSVQVEKRPLSNSVPKRNNPYDHFDEAKDLKPARRPDPVRIIPKSKKRSNALSLALIILITVILGIAAGVGVFFIIAN